MFNNCSRLFFSCSKKAVELGDANQKQMMALGLDRYLVSLGNKQLFGSQATKENSCWCLHQVESSFPEAKRIEQTGRTLKKSADWLLGIYNTNKSCMKLQCKKELRPSPKGTVPGYW